MDDVTDRVTDPDAPIVDAVDDDTSDDTASGPSTSRPTRDTCS